MTCFRAEARVSGGVDMSDYDTDDIPVSSIDFDFEEREDRADVSQVSSTLFQMYLIFRYITRNDGEHEILREIFHAASRFPLHFVLHPGNFDSLLDSVHVRPYSSEDNKYSHSNRVNQNKIMGARGLCRCFVRRRFTTREVSWGDILFMNR